MRILVLYDGDYGKRFWENMGGNPPPGWEVSGYHYGRKLPSYVEELAEFLPRGLPSCDLLISVCEQPTLAEMIPLLVKEIGAKVVMAPIDNKAYLTTGLARQIGRKLERVGVEFLHPLAFCSLTEKEVLSEVGREFVRYFGRPKVEIEIEQEKVKRVEVLRDAPCGNTRYVAAHLVGTHVKDAVERAGILHHNHPCMATMAMDQELGDTLMHHAGLQAKLAVGEAIKSN